MVGKFFFFLCVLLIPVSLFFAFFTSGPFAWLSGLLYIAYDTALLAFVAVRILRVLREPACSSAGTRPTIAVLIAARNEEHGLTPCLRALAAQSEPAGSVHLIDDGSEDQTAAVAQKHGLQVWRKPHTGKADSLNSVWPRVTEEVIVTLDADTILEPGALAAIRDAFGSDPFLAAAGGVLTPTCAGSGIKARLFQGFQRFEYVRAFLSRRAWMSSGALLLVSGAFGAYRKSVLAEVGGYDTHSLVEDYDLVHRIHRFAHERGVKRHVAVLVRARATTDSPAGFRAFLRQRERWFAGFLQTHFGSWDMVGNPAYGRVGSLMLPIKSLDTIQPIYGLVALVTLICLVVTRAKLHPLILGVLAGKLTLDLAFHFWSISLYARWTGARADWGRAAVASLLEPFTFQPLRHFGAALGWVVLARREHDWIKARPKLDVS